MEGGTCLNVLCRSRPISKVKNGFVSARTWFWGVSQWSGLVAAGSERKVRVGRHWRVVPGVHETIQRRSRPTFNWDRPRLRSTVSGVTAGPKLRPASFRFGLSTNVCDTTVATLMTGCSLSSPPIVVVGACSFSTLPLFPRNGLTSNPAKKTTD